MLTYSMMYVVGLCTSRSAEISNNVILIDQYTQ